MTSLPNAANYAQTSQLLRNAFAKIDQTNPDWGVIYSTPQGRDLLDNNSVVNTEKKREFLNTFNANDSWYQEAKANYYGEANALATSLTNYMNSTPSGGTATPGGMVGWGMARGTSPDGAQWMAGSPLPGNTGTSNTSSSSGTKTTDAIANLFSSDTFEKMKELNQLSLTPEQRSDITFVSDTNRKAQLDLLNPQLESTERIANINAGTDKYRVDVDAGTNKYIADLGAGTDRYRVDKETDLGKYTTDANNRTQLDLANITAGTNKYIADLGAGTDRYRIDEETKLGIYTTDANNRTQLDLANISADADKYRVDKETNLGIYTTDANNRTQLDLANIGADTDRYRIDKETNLGIYTTDANNRTQLELGSQKSATDRYLGDLEFLTAQAQTDAQKEIAAGSNQTQLELGSQKSETDRYLGGLGFLTAQAQTDAQKEIAAGNNQAQIGIEGIRSETQKDVNRTNLDIANTQVLGMLGAKRLETETSKTLGIMQDATARFAAGLSAETALKTTAMQGDAAKEIAAINSASQLGIVDTQEAGANFRAGIQSETDIRTTNRQAEAGEFAALQRTLSEQYKSDNERAIAGIQANTQRDVAGIQGSFQEKVAGIAAGAQRQGFLTQEKIAQITNETNALIAKGEQENALLMNRERLGNNLDVITKQGTEGRLLSQQQSNERKDEAVFNQALGEKTTRFQNNLARNLYVARGL